MSEEQKSTKLVIKHSKAKLYREVQPDGFLATQTSDANGHYVKVLVLKNDVEVTSETMSGEWDGEKMIQFDEEVVINQEPVRIQEMSLKLTPRMAVNLHTALTRELEDLPKDVAKQYGIEKME